MYFFSVSKKLEFINFMSIAKINNIHIILNGLLSDFGIYIVIIHELINKLGIY